MTADPEQGFLDPEDEDLFDFPKVQRPLADSVGTVEPEAEELDIDDLAAIKAEESGPAAPLPSVAAPTSNSSNETLDLGDMTAEDLDEDLFNFDASFLVQLSKGKSGLSVPPVPPPQAPAPVKAPDPAGAEAPTAPADPIAASPNQATTSEPVKTPPPVAAGAQRASNTAAYSAPASVPEMDMLDVPASMGYPPNLIVQEGRRNRVLELLAVGFILVGIGLVILLLQAKDQFQETLLLIAENSSASPQQVVIQAPAPIPAEPFVLNSATAPKPIAESKPDPEPSKSPALLPPSKTDTLAGQTLAGAETLIQKGRYEDARERLYHMLSNRDRSALPDSIISEAEILIVRAMQGQAKALSEAGR